MTAVPAPRFCSNCGAELPTGAQFCPRCGAVTASAAQAFPSGLKLVDVRGELLPLSPVGKRFGAMLIDWLAVSIVLYASFTVVFLAIAIIGLIELRDAFDFASLNSASWSSFAFFGASTLLSWSLDSYGWSPGKAVTGIRTVRLDGRRPGIVHGLVRYATRSIGLAALGLGYLWALWDERNQAWHDKLAGSVVVLAGPLAEQIGERRPRPLVVRRRVWWFAALSAVILCGSAALNVWIPTTFDEDFFESERFQPRQTDDGPRIHELETSEGDRLVVDLPARHLGRP